MNDDELKYLIMKFQKDEEHVRSLFKRGLHSIEITDRLIHIMLDVMHEGLKSKFPNATKEELFKKMKEITEDFRKIKLKI